MHDFYLLCANSDWLILSSDKDLVSIIVHEKKKITVLEVNFKVQISILNFLCFFSCNHELKSN